MNTVKHGTPRWTELGGGVKRSVLAHTKEIMAVAVQFDEGGVGPLHSHPHAQSTYVLSGRFVFTAGGGETDVAAGDTLAFEANETHGCVCKAAGTLIDTFSPMREDFL